MNFLNNAISAIKPRDDDTMFDRVNYYYSTIIIIVAAVTLTAKQYVGQPLQCWVPAEFTKAWEQYAENYCFVHNTYAVKPRENIPDEVEIREHRELIYYQWVPFLMVLEAGFFYLPVLFWSTMNTKSGLNISNMVQIVQRCDLTSTTEREKAVNTICTYLEDSVRLQKVRREGGSYAEKHLTMGLLRGSYLANIYLLTKLLYLFNVSGQFTMMNQFLGQYNYLWGAQVMNDIRNGRDWEQSGNFPRIVMCDFVVRNLGNVHRFSIQCVLVLNMFNEKIFLFLYIWFVLVFFLNFADMIRWAYMTKIASRRIAYITRFVKVPKDELILFREYCNKIINADGIMVLKLITIHSNDLVTQQILMTLWIKFKEEVTLSSIAAPPTGFESDSDDDDADSDASSPQKRTALQRTVSVMGTHVKFPVYSFPGFLRSGTPDRPPLSPDRSNESLSKSEKKKGIIESAPLPGRIPSIKFTSPSLTNIDKVVEEDTLPFVKQD